jgi:FkbM family methyltransferase
MLSYEQLKLSINQLVTEADEARKEGKSLSEIVSNFENLYCRDFSRPEFSNLNEIILKCALRARGYNNYRSNDESGEEFFLSKILAPRNPKLCIDVGANVGNYSQRILDITQATVVSFEPIPSAFAELQKLTRSFGERSILENKGVGERNERLSIHYSDEASSHASFSIDIKNVPYIRNEKELEVDVVSLDSYMREMSFAQIDLLKIDTEGFEAEVLRGAGETIQRCQPKFIQVEFNWHQLFRKTSLNYFSELLLGYSVFQLLPGAWIERDPKDPLSNIYHFSNFIFVKI